MSDLAQRALLRRDSSGTSPFVRVPYHRIGLYIALGDATLIFCASLFSDWVYSYFEYGHVPDIGMSAGVGIVACAVYELVARSWSLYSLPSLLALQPRWSPILLGWAAVFLVLSLVLFLLKVGAGVSRGSMIAFA